MIDLFFLACLTSTKPVKRTKNNPTPAPKRCIVHVLEALKITNRQIMGQSSTNLEPLSWLGNKQVIMREIGKRNGERKPSVMNNHL